MSERAACPRLFAFARRRRCAVSTFEQRTARRYNNTHCTYGVNLQHDGSISELHCAKSFFLARAETVHIFLHRIIPTNEQRAPEKKETRAHYYARCDSLYLFLVWYPDVMAWVIHSTYT
jgi:hypothetical protein